MKKTKREKQLIIITALIVAVIGLSIGFAAFATNLVISSSATVTPTSSDFGVKFSSSSTAVETNQITPTLSGATADKATLDNSGTTPKITGLKANFSAPGQSATYTFYVHNTGQYQAFLKSITFENATGGNSPKVCTKVDATATDNLISAACEDINVNITVGSQNATGSMSGITNHSLAAKTGTEAVTVTISYASNGDRADGDFNVSFGDIKLAYSSTDA